MSTTDIQPTTGRGRGFKSLSADERKRVASLGGKRAHELGRAHRFSPEEAQVAGRKGGLISRRRPKEKVQ